MDILDEVIEGLNAINASERNDYITDVELSEKWLGMSPRYVSMLRAKGQSPSLKSMTRLAARLKEHHSLLAESDLRREEAAKLYPVVKMVWKSLYEQALSE